MKDRISCQFSTLKSVCACVCVRETVYQISVSGFGVFIISLFYGTQPPVDQGRLINEASRSHSDTPHSVGLL
jgi:hypothetical protein